MTFNFFEIAKIHEELLRTGTRTGRTGNFGKFIIGHHHSTAHHQHQLKPDQNNKILHTPGRLGQDMFMSMKNMEKIGTMCDGQATNRFTVPGIK